jgi:hypothetical protein
VQFASFDLRDPVFEVLGLRLSAQLVTLENLYGIDPDAVHVEASAERVAVRAEALRWGGGQERAEGALLLEARREPGGALRLRVEGRAPAPLRCAKILLRDLDPALATSTDGQGWTPVGSWGERFVYPGRLHTPLLFARAGGRELALRAEDAEVRAKRFALYAERWGPLDGRGCAELIHEAAATRFGRSLAPRPERSRPSTSRGSSAPTACARSGLAPTCPAGRASCASC